MFSRTARVERDCHARHCTCQHHRRVTHVTWVISRSLGENRGAVELWNRRICRYRKLCLPSCYLLKERMRSWLDGLVLLLEPVRSTVVVAPNVSYSLGDLARFKWLSSVQRERQEKDLHVGRV